MDRTDTAPELEWRQGAARQYPKAGNPYLRELLVVGAMAVVRRAKQGSTKRPWVAQLLARKKPKVAAVALANKNARIIWAMMATGEPYREPELAAA